MTTAISPKLKGMLGLSIIVAMFGAWNLRGQDDVLSDVGFEPASELPIVVTTQPGFVAPLEETFTVSTRNPFTRSDGATDAEDADGIPVDGEEIEVEIEVEAPTTTSPPASVATTAGTNPTIPVFPNPDLIDDPGTTTAGGAPLDG